MLFRSLLDAAALCGLNTMHFHLTDDQGWRVEIKKYPKLTSVGSRRGDSYFGSVSETEHNCGFYTQDQIRQIVAHAQQRGTTTRHSHPLRHRPGASGRGRKTDTRGRTSRPHIQELHPWHFIVVDDKEMLQRMSEVRTMGAGPVARCAMAVVVAADTTLSDKAIS